MEFVDAVSEVAKVQGKDIESKPEIKYLKNRDGIIFKGTDLELESGKYEEYTASSFFVQKYRIHLYEKYPCLEERKMVIKVCKDMLQIAVGLGISGEDCLDAFDLYSRDLL